jgi:hypothetical protein
VATFNPPTDDFVRYGNPLEGGIQLRLWRFYQPEARGRNVYKLSDGTYTEVDLKDEGQISKVYHGGHIIEITDQEVTDLTAAGYGAYITA